VSDKHEASQSDGLDGSSPRQSGGPTIAILGACALLLASAAIWFAAGSDATNDTTAESSGNSVAGRSGRASSDSVDSEASNIGDEEVLKAAEDFYRSRPYYQQPVGHLEVPDGLPNLEAETCGGCHTEIYEEWSISTHRRAWKQDAQFMAELEKSRTGSTAEDSSKDDVGWMCVTCHTPVTNQLERVVVGLRDGNIGKPIYRKNPSYNPRLQKEAITCATCHVRNGKVYGPYGDTDAPHPTAKDPSLRDSSTCTECHQAEAHWPSRSLACFFSTGEEWSQSQYAKNGETCQSCHMPTVTRKLAKGFDRPKRKTRRHWFGGSLIPKHPKYTEEIARLQKVYGSGADITLIPAQEAKNVELASNGSLKTSSCPPDRSCRSYIVRITNEHAGHYVPTGDPERHLDVTATVRTEDGTVVTEASQRIASKYKWWPDIREQYDNRLPPKEHLDFEVHIPEGSDEYSIQISAHKYRMYMDAFEHHDLEGEYVRGRRFYHARWHIDSAGNLTLERKETDKGRVINDSHTATPVGEDHR
jgi:hypothetical protein